MKLPVNRNSVQAFLPNLTLKDYIYQSEHHNGHCHATKYKKTGLAYRKPAEFFYAHNKHSTSDINVSHIYGMEIFPAVSPGAGCSR